MKKKWKRFGIVILVFMVSFIGISSAMSESIVERINRTGGIRVGYSSAPPFCFVDEDGNITGNSPEIFKVIAKKLGIKIKEAVLTEWAGMIPGLLAGRFDIITADMFIIPKRCKHVLFTDPHYKLGTAFLVKKGNPKNLHSYADIAKNPDAILCMLAGASNYEEAIKEGIPESRIMLVSDLPGNIAAVRSGRADAVAETTVSIALMAEKGGPELEVAKPFHLKPYMISYGGWAFRKEDKDLMELFNGAMKEFIGTKEHLELVKPFGFTEVTLPDNKTAAECCAGQ